MFIIVVTEPGNLSLSKYPPEPGPYEALIQTEVACLGNATDRNWLTGISRVDISPLLGQ